MRIQAEEDECKRRLCPGAGRVGPIQEGGRRVRRPASSEGRARLVEIGKLNARIELLGACEAEIRRTEERIDASTEELARCNRSLDEAAAGVRALRQRGGVYAADEKAPKQRCFVGLKGWRRNLCVLSVESSRLKTPSTGPERRLKRVTNKTRQRFRNLIKLILACCIVLFLAGVATAVKGLSGSDAFLVCVGLCGWRVCDWRGSFFSQRKKKSRAASAKKGEGEVSEARRVLEVCEQDELMFSLRSGKMLDAMGLAEAQGSIRNARIIMERVSLSAFGAARNRGADKGSLKPEKPQT